MTVVDMDDTMFNEHTEHTDNPIEENREIDHDDPGERYFDYPTTLNNQQPTAMTTTTTSHDIEQDGITIEKTMLVNKKKINPDFQDFAETGKWGTISRTEIVCVAVTLLVLVVGVVVTIVMLTTKNNGNDGNSVAVPAPAVVTQPSYYTPEEQYAALLKAIQQHPAVVSDPIMSNLATDLNNLVTTDVYSQAASWLVHDDPVKVHYVSDLLPRFALATTYYANGGLNWNNSTTWLSAFDVCTWYGVSCNVAKEVTEVDLTKNGLTGALHEAWALLHNCTSLILSSNALTGPIPGEAFANMPNLVYLYLQNNKLNGTIPLSLKDAGQLGTMAC